MVSIQEEQSTPSPEKDDINGYHVNGAINDIESVDSLSEGMETLSIDAKELEDPESSMPDILDRTGEFINRSLKRSVAFSVRGFLVEKAIELNQSLKFQFLLPLM